MIHSDKSLSSGRLPLTLVLAAAMLAGCASKEQKAIDQAKAQAVKTGQPQQVVTVDKSGNTTTTVVQPPAQGQTAEEISTTIKPPTAAVPLPAPSGPTVSAVPMPPAVPLKVSIPAGTMLAIRVDQRISVKSGHAGETFTGEVVEPVVASDGSTVVPKGAPVGGVVDEARRRGHFKGRSLLELRLTSLTLNGTKFQLTTKDLQRTKKGKGRRSAAMIGGGTGLGMVVGGVASGGVGLVVGSLVGGGAGTAAAGLTGNRDIVIPAESIVHFTLADDLVV
jgi:hypothetical protein